MSDWLKEKGGDDDLIKGLVILGGIGALSSWLHDKLAPILEPQQYDPNKPGLFDQLVDGVTTAVSYGLGAGLIAGAVYTGVRIFQLKQNKEVEAIRISPSREHDVKPENVQKLVKAFYYIQPHWVEKLLKGRMWFRYLILKDEKGKISFRLLVPKDRSYSFQQLLKEYLPNHSISVDRDFKGIPFYKKGTGISGHLVFSSKKKGYGLNDKLQNNMGSIVNIMPNASVIDIRFSPTDIDELREDGGSAIGRILSKEKKTKEDNMDLNEIINRFRGHSAFDVAIHLWSRSGITDMARQIRQHTQGINNGLKLKKYWLLPDLRNGLNYNFVLPKRTMVWNDTELAQLFFTPPVDHQVMEHIEAIFDKLKPKAGELTKGLRIGFADHDDYLPPMEERTIERIIEEGRPIRLQWDTLDRHGVVVGATGAGKGGFLGSVADGFLEGWVDGKVEAGFTLQDPHESAVLLVINRLLELEKQGKQVPWEKVRCYSFDPANEYPTPMNILYYGDEYKGSNSRKAEEAAQIILSAFPGELSKSAVLLQMALEALLADGKQHTIAHVTKLFRDETFLDDVMSKIDNEFVLEMLQEHQAELERKGKSANIDALVTRLFPFIGHTDMKRSFCQQTNVINGKRIIENGEIVLLSFKNAPEASFRLTAGWLANHYFNVAIGREPYTGKHHYLIFDEAQMFRIGRFADIIQQTRKFRLGLWLITQNIDELDDRVKDAIETNLGFLVALRQNKGVKKSVELSKGIFSQAMIEHLPDNHAALYSVEGAANVLFPPPALIYNGKRTEKGSLDAEKAYREAKAKFVELMKRDCKHYTEVENEMKQAEGRSFQMVAGGGLRSVD